MSIPAITFKDLLKNLAGQFIENRYAECVLDELGSHINVNAKDFFSIVVIEEKLEGDIAVVGVLSDDILDPPYKKSYTFFIFVDLSKDSVNMTKDLKDVCLKLILSHEICHFAFYYELFLDLGKGGISTTIYDTFRNIVSGTLKDAITPEKDMTSETVIEEHTLTELLRNCTLYPNSHFCKNRATSLDFQNLFSNFFDFITKE